MPPEVKARECRSSAGGRWRHRFSSGSAEGVAGCGILVIFFALFVCGVLDEVFDGIGWGHAADVTAWVGGFLMLFACPVLVVYVVVKVRRGEMHW
jgi:hypothetical protein